MTAATATLGDLPQPERARGGRRSADGYAAALRHTRLVRFLRKAIPIGAVVSFAILIVFPFINPFRAAGIAVGAIKMDGTRVTMENPRMAGHRKDNKPYEVTAVSAVQDIRKPNVIEMFGMTARLVNSDDGVINLTAKSAIFDSQKEQMTLREDVRVRTLSGQEAFLKSADVDFKAGTVRSRDEVIVRFPDMGVTADSLDVADSGSRIAFIGRVRALIDDKGSKGAAAAQTGARQPEPAAAPRAGQAAPEARPQAAAERGNALRGVVSTGQQPATQPTAPPVRDARGVTVIDPATGRAIPPGTSP
jgi:lipopolysaccharide export system protein LptC